MKDFEDVQRLVRLKQYETPGEEYFEQFAEDFKDRQRAELLQRSSRSLLAERVTTWWDEWNTGAKWLVPTGAAAAAVGVGIYLTTNTTSENSVPQSLVGGQELPEFPEAPDQVIHLELPDVEAEAIPEEKPKQFSKLVQPAGFREL